MNLDFVAPRFIIANYAFVLVAFCRSLPPSLASPVSPRGHRLGPTGFTRSSTTVFGSSPGATGKKVRLISRNGKDLTYRFPHAVQAVGALPVNSCTIDGEAIVSDITGLAVFSLIRSYRNGPRATLCAFDLIELDGTRPALATDRGPQGCPQEADQQPASRYRLQ